MPREYRTTGGPAAPSPSGFGSADINLQTPRFVAQTAVAMPEDPFAALQKILGMATEVGTQALRYQAADIEGKISYQRAIEAKQEREDVLKRRTEADLDRENARLATEFSAAAKLEIAKAKTPEEAKVIEERLLKEAREGETTEMKAARAQVIEQAESESRQIQAALDRTKQEERQAFLDSALSIKAQGEERIQNAFEAADPGALDDIAITYALHAENETDPRLKDLYTGLRTKAFSAKQAVEGKTEIDNKRQEAALVTAARETFSVAASEVVTGLRADLMKTAELFDSATDSALEQAVFDTVREKILADKLMLGLVTNMSPEEGKAVSEAIRQKADVLVRDMVSARNDKYRRQAEDTKISAWMAEGSVNFDATVEAINNDTTVSDAARRRAYAEVAKARVAAENTDIGKLKVATNMYGSGNPVLDSQSVRMTKEILGNIGTRVQQERTNLLDYNRNQGDDLSKGWTSRYNTRDEFLKDILHRHFGTDIESLKNPEVSNIIGPTVNRLVNQWEEDVADSNRVQKAAEIEARASNVERRRRMKIDDNWRSSPLARVLADGSHSKIKVEELEPMITDAVIGYSDSKMPDELRAKVVDGFDNPNNFSLITAYWNVMNRAMDPTARNKVLNSSSDMRSWALGSYFGFLGPEVDPGTTATLGSEMARNLLTKGDTDSDSVKKELETRRNKAISILTDGVGIDTGWFDFTGIESSEVMARLPPADQTTMLHMSQVAASAPSNTDTGGFMASLMKQQGFAIYPIKDDNGNNSFRLVQNVVGARGTTPLPHPSVLESNEWRAYLLSKKQAIVDAFNAMPKLDVPGGGAGETIFRPENVEDVRIAVYDQDVKQGYVAVRAKVSGIWRSVPVNAVSVSVNDFQASRESMKSGFIKSLNLSDNNPWIPDAYESLFK